MKIKQLLPLADAIQARESVRGYYYNGRMWNLAGLALTDRGTLQPIIADGLHIMAVDDADIEKLDPQRIFDE